MKHTIPSSPSFPVIPTVPFPPPPSPLLLLLLPPPPIPHFPNPSNTFPSLLLLHACLSLLLPPIYSFSTGTGFIFEDQFLQISALLPSPNIYGLGEHTTRLRLPTNTTLTMFSHDTPPMPSVSPWGMGGSVKDARMMGLRRKTVMKACY